MGVLKAIKMLLITHLCIGLILCLPSYEFALLYFSGALLELIVLTIGLQI